MTEELAKYEGSPDAIMHIAIEKGADLEKVEKMLELKMRYEGNEAKKAYNKAMVQVHKGIPMVAKSLKNPTTHSSYASLDMIITKTKEIYTEHGFSVSFYEGESTKEDHIRICADVLHELGHKEPYHYDVPLDGKGIKGNVNMTAIHAKASSTSYARRYLMCMIFNIPTGDDNDGNNTTPPSRTVERPTASAPTQAQSQGGNIRPASDKQINMINKIIEKGDIERMTADICIQYGLDAINELNIKQASELISRLMGS